LNFEEGDLVISINNVKVTDLDHDHVVDLVSQSKFLLMVQVTKLIDQSTNIENPKSTLSEKKHSTKCQPNRHSSQTRIERKKNKINYTNKKSNLSERKLAKFHDLTIASQSSCSSSSNLAIMSSYENYTTKSAESTADYEDNYDFCSENQFDSENKYTNQILVKELTTNRNYNHSQSSKSLKLKNNHKSQNKNVNKWQKTEQKDLFTENQFIHKKRQIAQKNTTGIRDYENILDTEVNHNKK
jgi:hypothetical protein